MIHKMDRAELAWGLEEQDRREALRKANAEFLRRLNRDYPHLSPNPPKSKPASKPKTKAKVKPKPKRDWIFVKQPTERVRVRDIVKAACLAGQIPQVEMLSQRRNRRLVTWRHAAMWMAHDMTPASMTMIAEAFGKSDHTTAIHGIKKVSASPDLYADHIHRIKIELARM